MWEEVDTDSDARHRYATKVKYGQDSTQLAAAACRYRVRYTMLAGARGIKRARAACTLMSSWAKVETTSLVGLLASL